MILLEFKIQIRKKNDCTFVVFNNLLLFTIIVITCFSIILIFIVFCLCYCFTDERWFVEQSRRSWHNRREQRDDHKDRQPHGARQCRSVLLRARRPYEQCRRVLVSDIEWILFDANQSSNGETNHVVVFQTTRNRKNKNLLSNLLIKQTISKML